ncbi:PREDICTED: protein LBH [Miniopterus natalensis]|uniref:protein LBH n=1 Tax=Miniopterus natalensis TaxID=291302 RepID=UPI0007A6BE1F|nr:PREDICTED: protein LBH [Miniopterus natalensis]
MKVDSCPWRKLADILSIEKKTESAFLHKKLFPDYLRSAEMTEVMMNTPSMEEIGLSPRKDGLSYQIFPDPSDFDRCCKLKDRLPSIVVEPTEGEVESGELRWPPEEFLVQEDEQDNCDETAKENKEQ